MNTTKTNPITSAAPGRVMLLVDADDLKAMVTEMWNVHRAQTDEAVAMQREKPTMTRRQAAKALNVTLSTLWRWAREGYLTPVKIGTKVLYRATDIDTLLSRRRATV